jgi:hypothetical protein
LNGGNHIEQQVREHGELWAKEDVLREREYYEGFDSDKSSKYEKIWNDFWEENYYPEEHQQYTEEELNAMCDKAALDSNQPKKLATYDEMVADGWTMTADGVWVKGPKEDKVVKWQLPVEVDGLTGDCFIQFPDDLLEAANLKEGDSISWIDRKDGSFELRKVNGTK